MRFVNCDAGLRPYRGIVTALAVAACVTCAGAAPEETKNGKRYYSESSEANSADADAEKNAADNGSNDSAPSGKKKSAARNAKKRKPAARQVSYYDYLARSGQGATMAPANGYAPAMQYPAATDVPPSWRGMIWPAQPPCGYSY